MQGGDINDVFLLKTTIGNKVVKINFTSRFPKMFEKEADGLKRLAETKSFKILKIIGFGEISTYSYLLLEYISPGEKQKDFWVNFAKNLAILHQNSSPTFGLDTDNYIGSLPQYNKSEIKNPVDFYIEKRLQPQFELAKQQGFTFKELSIFYKNLEEIIPFEKPALIHGDLWGGNYLTAKNNTPVLIDPAVAFAPREMDIAMMKLFGGFPEEVFAIYHEIFPMQKDWEDRIKIWQLYYVLVHLNLFGRSYLNAVKNILKRFS